MYDENDFTPYLGRLRARGGGRSRTFLQRVLQARALAGAVRRGSRRFNGSRIARGSVVARQLASRGRFAAHHQRRVMVKYRIARLNKPNGKGAARAHLRYIQRDGVTRDGEPGRLYSADADQVGGKAFHERCDGDRHQFRFIVSPEDGQQYDDLKSLTRRLTAQMERDLGTTLDWVAVDHFNTGHPHTHIVVRGISDRGEDLVIDGEYLTGGLRQRARELVSIDLGPRTDIEIEDTLRHEIEQERLTSIDRRLLRDAGNDRIVAAADRDSFYQSLRAGRLQKLGHLGLADEIEPGRWRLAESMDMTLKEMGERGDIIRTMQRAFTAHGLERAATDYAIADSATMTPIVGRVVERGLSDEYNDRHYLIVDATDGRSHYVDIGNAEATDFVPTGAVVRITPKSIEARAVDHTIAEVAAANGGRYSIDLHLVHDSNARQPFAETHVRRLEAMRKLMSSVEREPDGTWIIAPDHIERAAAFEARRAKTAPVIVDTLSSITIERQVGAGAATWLDRELIADRAEPLCDAGFGRDVREALLRRRQWLIEQGLAREEQGRIVYRANLLAVLRRRELSRVAGQLADELGIPYAEARSGERIDATIAEITLNESLSYGVQFFLKSRDIGAGDDKGSGLLTRGTTAVLGRALPGFNFLLGTEAEPRLILDALRTVSDVKVLSTPSVVVLDNQVATLQVGDQVPVATASATVLTGTGAPVVNTIDYRNTGVILRVVPRINSNGNVLLDVEQEISNVAAGSAGSLTPTVSQRRVKSSIAVANGQTVLLAGLISERSDSSRSGLPLVDQLGEFGKLFGGNNRSAQRTELIIFIRPQIIRDGVDAMRVAEELRTKLRGRLGTTDPNYRTR